MNGRKHTANAVVITKDIINNKEMENRITPDFITSLKENEIFVFGCRRSGRHWEGAAAFALENFGAVFGQGEGLQGRSYAIATAGVGLVDVKAAVDRFTKYAMDILNCILGNSHRLWIRRLASSPNCTNV